MLLYTYNVCTMHVQNTCIPLRGVLTSESQGLTIYALVMLLLAMISLHMLTFSLMVTIVAEFLSSFIIHCWER